MSKVDDVMRIMSAELDRYRNSIPRKAFVRAMERVIEEVIGPSEDIHPTAPGIQIIKQPDITADDLAGLLSGCCPPYQYSEAVNCDDVSCRNCWRAWLETGRPPCKGGGANA